MCPELRKKVSEETAAKEALQAAYASAQRDYDDLEEAALVYCVDMLLYPLAAAKGY